MKTVLHAHANTLSSANNLVVQLLRFNLFKRNLLMLIPRLPSVYTPTYRWVG